MKNLILYHGSQERLEKPVFGFGKPYNDYGLGFYCTENLELAKEWAVTENSNGFANEYRLDLSGLKILDLSAVEYTALHWLTLLLSNRVFSIKHDIARMGREYLIANYLIDINAYDLIKGYRADDSYFSFAQSFLNNTISLEKLSRALRIGNLGEQVVLKSKKAFENLEFIQSHDADCVKYWALRAERNENARRQYMETVNSPLTSEDIFLSDIIRRGL